MGFLWSIDPRSELAVAVQGPTCWTSSWTGLKAGRARARAPCLAGGVAPGTGPGHRGRGRAARTGAQCVPGRLRPGPAHPGPVAARSRAPRQAAGSRQVNGPGRPSSTTQRRGRNRGPGMAGRPANRPPTRRPRRLPPTPMADRRAEHVRQVSARPMPIPSPGRPAGPPAIISKRDRRITQSHPESRHRPMRPWRRRPGTLARTAEAIAAMAEQDDEHADADQVCGRASGSLRRAWIQAPRRPGQRRPSEHEARQHRAAVGGPSPPGSVTKGVGAEEAET